MPPPEELPPLCKPPVLPDSPGALQDAQTNHNNPLYWYYGDDAGGRIVDVGFIRGERLRDLGLGLVTRTYINRHKIYIPDYYRPAVDLYKTGLSNYINTHYMDVVVPFRGSCWNMTLWECRHDIAWMDNLLQEKYLDLYGDNFDIFFVALSHLRDDYPYSW